ncbi:MAG: hypothetical protein IH800_10310 [Myxococcales bacterium]|nr:hypothetical protein [Myxococcales bacterium]
MAGVFLALLALAPTPVWALEQNKDQRRCINQVNKNFAKVASAQGKEICDCIKRGSKESLAGTIEECMTADAKGKVEKAQQKTLSKESKSCGTTPEFGYSSGANANDAAIAKELAIIHGIFGDNLDAVIMTEFMAKNAAKCQHAVAKQAKKCQDAKLKVFTSCKKDALKGGKSAAPVESAQQLQDACLGTGAEAMPDPKGKIQKDCVDKLGDTIDKKCTSKEGVVLSAVFPLFDPNGGSTLQAFVDRIIECEACKAINQADALNRNCDLFDDGLANGSCGCFHDKCVAGAALIPACDPCVTTICALDSFCCETQWDTPCRGAVFDVCGSSDCAPPCEGDPSLTFVGGPGRMACRGLADQSACEGAYHATIDFSAASCFWTGSECRGCGPSNAGAGACTNSCEP